MVCAQRIVYSGISSLTVRNFDSVAELDWVLAQTMERKRREMEEIDREYAERLRKAKRKEELLRKAARARVHKRQVRVMHLLMRFLVNLYCRKHLTNHKTTT